MPPVKASTARNIALYPWLRFIESLTFWQAVWFLYFQQNLSAAEAILLYATYEVAVTVLEVPSGYMSDRLGRRRTLIASALAMLGGVVLLAIGGSFGIFMLGQALIGAGMAFWSGTDSSLLYESLAAEGREGEIEVHELRAWRYSYSAAALSAVAGGALALLDPSAPFWATALAALGLLTLLLACQEPVRHLHRDAGESITGLRSLKASLLNPVLGWLFVINLLMYVFSHIPFVFGQPFILEALSGIGLASEAPLISGTVSAIMMGVSVIASAFVLRIRGAMGLRGMVLLAFGIQIGLCAVLGLSNSALVIAVLFLRMVPDALSRPFIMARIQPLLSSDSRATYLSLKSLCGRVIFAASLYVASGSTSGVGNMAYADIRAILGWYVLAGVALFAGLFIAARRMGSIQGD